MQIRNMIKKLGRYLLFGILGYFLVIGFVLIIFKWVPIPSSAFMLRQDFIAWRYGNDYAEVRYQWKSWEDLPKSTALAVIASEDQRFPYHSGLDFQAIRAALSESRYRKRGASTITQQVVKNLFLWGERSYIRKGLEASITPMMELIWSKQRILEVYLNIAQFGKREYGVAAAQKYLFKKEKLSFADAALLAGVLPAPSRYKIQKPSKKLRKRQRWIQKQMRQLGGLKYLEKLE